MEKEKVEQQSLIAPLLKNSFVTAMLKGKIPKGESFLLLTSDMVSDLTLRGSTQELLLAELKDMLCIWPTSHNNVNDRHLKVSAVYLLREQTIHAFSINKSYAFGEFNLLAEDIFLLYENKNYEHRKI